MAKLNKTRQLLIDSYKRALTEGDYIWKKGWRAPEMPKNAMSNRKYNGVNKALLYFMSMQKGYKDPRWATYNQAQKEGWQVRKGEKGIPVEFWYLYDKKNRTQIDPKKAEQEIAKDKERSKDFFWLSRTFTVFNCQQMDNVPEYEQPQTKWEEGELSDFALNVVTALGVEYGEGGGQAYYMPSEDRINVPEKESFYSEYEFASTLLHECSHASMNQRRLNYNFGSPGFGSPGYAKEELVAEMSSSFLCGDLGIEMGQDHIDNHTAYVHSWLEVLEKNPEELFASISKAEKVCNYIEEIGELEKFKENKEQDLEESIEREYA